MMVLSGMSDMAQMQDNISYMKEFQPLSKQKLEAVDKVQKIFKSMNTKQIYHDWNADYYYNVVHTGGGNILWVFGMSAD